MFLCLGSNQQQQNCGQVFHSIWLKIEQRSESYKDKCSHHAVCWRRALLSSEEQFNFRNYTSAVVFGRLPCPRSLSPPLWQQEHVLLPTPGWPSSGLKVGLKYHLEAPHLRGAILLNNISKTHSRVPKLSHHSFHCWELSWTGWCVLKNGSELNLMGSFNKGNFIIAPSMTCWCLALCLVLLE